MLSNTIKRNIPNFLCEVNISNKINLTYGHGITYLCWMCW